MHEIFLKALDKLTDPIAIIALLLMIVVMVQNRALGKHVVDNSRVMGKLTALIQGIVQNGKKTDN